MKTDEKKRRRESREERWKGKKGGQRGRQEKRWSERRDCSWRRGGGGGCSLAPSGVIGSWTANLSRLNQQQQRWLQHHRGLLGKKEKGGWKWREVEGVCVRGEGLRKTLEKGENGGWKMKRGRRWKDVQGRREEELRGGTDNDQYPCWISQTWWRGNTRTLTV